MNVLHHLAMQSEALVILLQETHCTDAEKLVLPNYQLAGSSSSRKHSLATFVHERLRYTLLDQYPPTSEIEIEDVDGYKIVNVSKPPPTRLQSLDLPVFLTPVCTLAILIVVMLTGVTMITVRMVSAWLAGQVLIVLPSYIMPRTLLAFSGRWNTVTNPDLAFASVRPNSCLPDRRSLKSFLGHNIDLRLLHHQGLLWQCQACLLSDGTSIRPIGVTTLL